MAAVIGDPVAHSLSPAIHNAAFDALGLDWIYLAFEVAAGDGGAAMDAMRVMKMRGLSVTMPHKADVIASVDQRSPAVEALGAANCIVDVGDGRLRAENTDGAGFIDALLDDTGITPSGRSVVVIGAGGAARAVIRAVAQAGAREVNVINRSADSATLAASLAGPVGAVSTLDSIAGADIVVNATSVGMGTDPAMPCDPGLIRSGQVVVDLIYNPASSPWLSALREQGVVGHNGLSMLVRQAALAFTLWTGAEAPINAMRSAALSELQKR